MANDYSITKPVDSYKDLPSYEDYLASRKPKTELGKEDFLSLLAAQLQYQNPLEPMTDSAFVAQLAQFSSLEQIENLNNTMKQYNYFNLAGKYVYTVGNLDGVETVISGLVDRVMLVDGVAYVEVGGYQFEASKVTAIYDKDIFTGGSSLAEGASLIGRYVRAEVAQKDADGNVKKDDKGKEITREVIGRVSGVSIEGGMLAVTIETADGEETVHVGALTKISDTEIAPTKPAPTEPEPEEETNPVEPEPEPEP